MHEKIIYDVKLFNLNCTFKFINMDEHVALLLK